MQEPPGRPNAPSGAGRGRPKDPDKHAAILHAAKKLITVRGLSGTSMEEIAAEAGVSKLTVYSHFSNKEELFRQTVFAKCGEHWPAVLFDTHARQPLKLRLNLIGRGFLDLVNSEDVIRLYRLLSAEGEQGEFGSLFWEAGPERTMQRFAQVLEMADRAGELLVPDARKAAAHFFMLLKGEHHLKCMVGAGPPPLDPAAREKHVDDVVDLFMRAHQCVGSD